MFNSNKSFALVALVLGLSVLATSSANAQFVGDYFFRSASSLVDVGDQVELELDFFSGSRAFGAVALEITLNPDEFRIDQVVMGEDFEASICTVDSTDPASNSATTKVAVFNESSLQDPIGTVSVIKIVGTPLVAGGESTQLQVTSIDSLDSTGVAFPSPSSTATAVVSVADSSTPVAATSMSVTILPPERATENGIAARPGDGNYDAWVTYQKSGRREWQLVELSTIDPAAPKDDVPGIEKLIVEEKALSAVELYEVKGHVQEAKNREEK